MNTETKSNNRGGKPWTPAQYAKYNATIAARKAAPATPATSAIKVLAHGKINFDVVDRIYLPIEFDLSTESMYRELFTQTCNLPKGQVIVVNTKGRVEMRNIYNALMYRINNDARFTGLEVRQRHPKVFIYRSEK